MLNACLSLALLPLFAPADEGVLLRLKLAEGMKSLYSVKFQSQQTMTNDMMGSDQQISYDGSMKIAYLFSKFDKEKNVADLTMNVTDLKLEFGGAAAMAQAMMGDIPSSYTVNAKIDDRNRVSGSKVEGLSGQARIMLAQATEGMQALASVPFPEKAVAIGDTWEMALPASPWWGQRQKLTVKLIGESKALDMPAYEISIEGVLDVDTDIGKAMQEAGADAGPMGDMKILMKSKIEVGSKAFVCKETGALIQLTSKMDSKGNIELPDMGMTIDVVGTLSSSYDLVKE